MAQITDDQSIVDVSEIKNGEGGIFVTVKKFGVGSDISGKFKVSGWLGVEPAGELTIFVPHSQQIDNLEALAEVLTQLSKTVRVVVTNEAKELENKFFEQF